MGKVCSFFGHRRIEKTEALAQRVYNEILRLIKEYNVKTFLFGSRSEFDALFYEKVTKIQNVYSDIKRIAFPCRSEYACRKKKEELERSLRALTNKDFQIQDYDGVVECQQVYNAGVASYVKRNQAMINASDICVFYYNPDYLPQKRKHSKREWNEYQPKSGTRLAFEYANQKQRGGKNLTIVNLFENACQQGGL